MARIVEHLSLEELEARYRAARDATEARHHQAIWLLAQGRTFVEVAEVLAFVPRWVEELAARYNAFGPEALGDQRRRNGRTATPADRGCAVRLGRAGDGCRPRTAGCGAAPRWPPGWRGVSAWRRCIRSAAGKRCGGSAGRSRRRGRGMRGRRPPRSRRPLKGGRSGGRAGQGGTSWPSRRGLGRGRAPPRPEADPAPGLGAGRPAADRPRPPSVPVAARGRLRPADQRRDGVVSRDRPVEALLRGPARRLRPADRRGPEAPHHPGARQCRLAWPRRFWPSPRGSAWRSCRPTLRSCSRPSTLVAGRRADRQSASPRWMRSHATVAERCRRLDAEHHPAAHRFPLVAEADEAVLISRSW